MNLGTFNWPREFVVWLVGNLVWMAVVYVATKHYAQWKGFTRDMVRIFIGALIAGTGGTLVWIFAPMDVPRTAVVAYYAMKTMASLMGAWFPGFLILVVFGDKDEPWKEQVLLASGVALAAFMIVVIPCLILIQMNRP